jgi:reductive dehalogenase
VEIMTVILIAFGLVIVLGLGAFGLTSWREGERRAARIAAGLAVVVSTLVFLSTLLPASGQWGVLGFVAVAFAVGVVLFLLPVGRVQRGDDVSRMRIDERDIMFARARLEPGTPNYKAYYAMRPENKASDDKIRSLPGLLSPEGSEAIPLVFAATEATFDLIDTMQEATDGSAAPERTDHEAKAMSAFVKGLVGYWGAHTVGITELQPTHIYSHIGRGRGEYGAPVALEHRYAIAFTVEMAQAMVGTAPAAPTLLESARQYANAAQIAVQLSILIRSLGYPARAHIDGNYRVVAPLVARDAGLGEIGRMGLLMTPGLGPRVRLGVVTTDLPLIPDRRSDELSVLDFCRICEKCADNCPVRAIPRGNREEIDGALRWRINQDICYRYWCTTGTDCARCVAVCPYSHANNAMHNAVRWAVRQSGLARRAMLWLDDVFYGAAPEPKPAPVWVRSGSAGSVRRIDMKSSEE